MARAERKLPKYYRRWVNETEQNSSFLNKQEQSSSALTADILKKYQFSFDDITRCHLDFYEDPFLELESLLSTFAFTWGPISKNVGKSTFLISENVEKSTFALAINENVGKTAFAISKNVGIMPTLRFHGRATTFGTMFIPQLVHTTYLPDCGVYPSLDISNFHFIINVGRSYDNLVSKRSYPSAKLIEQHCDEKEIFGISIFPSARNPIDVG